MSVDVRSRVDGEVVLIEPARCLGQDLPAAFERNREVLARAVQAFAPPSLVIEVDGATWTLMADRGPACAGSWQVRVTPEAADDPGVVLRLTVEQLTDLVNDQVTVVGLQTNGTLDQPVGRFGALLDWWLLLRCAERAHVAGDIDLVDASSAAAPRSQLLRRRAARRVGRLPQRGYLHIDGVFTEDEMAAVSLDMDRAAPMYPDDGRSWWARNAAGEQLLVRMQYFDDVSPAVDRLVHDERCCVWPGSPATATCSAAWRTTASRRCSSRSTWFEDLDLPGTRTARSVATATTAAA
jgi:hypothetical protein